MFALTKNSYINNIFFDFIINRLPHSFKEEIGKKIIAFLKNFVKLYDSDPISFSDYLFKILDSKSNLKLPWTLEEMIDAKSHVLNNYFDT